MAETFTMNFAQALDQTIDECGIQVKWLAARAGVSQQMIASYRNKKQQIKTDSLEKIISALPIEAKQYFFKQVNIHAGDLLSSINAMDDAELAVLLTAIANKIQKGKVQASSQELISA